MHAFNNAQTLPRTTMSADPRVCPLSGRTGLPAEVKSQVVSRLRHTGNTGRPAEVKSQVVSRLRHTGNTG